MFEAYEIMRKNIFKKLKDSIDAYIIVENVDNSLEVIINKDNETFTFYNENFFQIYVDFDSYIYIVDRIIRLYKKHILGKYFYAYRK